MKDSPDRAFRGTSRLRHRTVAVATASGLGLALALSGCGSVLGGHSAGSTPAPATVTVTPAADSTPTVLPGATNSSGQADGSNGSTDGSTDNGSAPATDAGTAPASTSSTGPDQLGSVVASRTGSTTNGGSARIDVFPLKRSGTTMTATIRVTLLKGVSGTQSGNLASTFSDNNNAQSDSGSWAPDGIKAIDGKHRMAYLVGSDGKGVCICSPRSLLNPVLDVGQSVTVSTTYAAPPSDVTSMALLVPSFGTINDVPVQ